MAERDAFGNERGENPLAGMGWSTGGLTSPSEPATAVTPPGPVAPAPAPPASAAAPPVVGVAAADAFGDSAPAAGPPMPPPGSPTSTGLPGYRLPAGVRLVRRLILLVVPLAVFGGAGLAILSVGGSVSDSVQDARRAISTSLDAVTIPTPSVAVPEAPGAPATPPTGFGTGSLLLRSNFAHALRTLRSEGSRLRSLRVAADRIDASIITRDGRMKQVQVTWQGRLQRFSTSGPGFPTAGSFSIAGLERSAPFRLARSAAGRARKAPSSIDYLVALDLGGGQAWTVFVKDGGGQYHADRAGRITRKVS